MHAYTCIPRRLGVSDWDGGGGGGGGGVFRGVMTPLQLCSVFDRARDNTESSSNEAPESAACSNE